MEILLRPGGLIRCLYDEAIDLSALGTPSIHRASHVEPDSSCKWLADLGPVHGPVLGPFTTRSQALDAEQRWLTEHWLIPDRSN